MSIGPGPRRAVTATRAADTLRPWSTCGSSSRPTAASKVLDLLEAAPSASNLVFLAGAARQPKGDVVLCDIAREDASVADRRPEGAGRRAATARSRSSRSTRRSPTRPTGPSGRPAGMPSDAVVWEEVEARTSESTELGGNFLVFMVLACLIASVGIFTRLADPDRRRDGRRPRVRAARRPLRGDGRAPARASPCAR